MIYMPTIDRKGNSIKVQKRLDETAFFSVQSVAVSFMLLVEFGVVEGACGSFNPSGY